MYNYQPNPPSNSPLALAWAVGGKLAVFEFLFLEKNGSTPPLNSPLALAWAVSGELAWSACTTHHSIEPQQALTLGLLERAEVCDSIGRAGLVEESETSVCPKHSQEDTRLFNF